MSKRTASQVFKPQAVQHQTFDDESDDLDLREDTTMLAQIDAESQLISHPSKPSDAADISSLSISQRSTLSNSIPQTDPHAPIFEPRHSTRVIKSVNYKVGPLMLSDGVSDDENFDPSDKPFHEAFEPLLSKCAPLTVIGVNMTSRHKRRRIQTVNESNEDVHDADKAQGIKKSSTQAHQTINGN